MTANRIEKLLKAKYAVIYEVDEWDGKPHFPFTFLKTYYIKSGKLDELLTKSEFDSIKNKLTKVVEHDGVHYRLKK